MIVEGRTSTFHGLVMTESRWWLWKFEDSASVRFFEKRCTRRRDQPFLAALCSKTMSNGQLGMKQKQSENDRVHI